MRRILAIAVLVALLCSSISEVHAQSKRHARERGGTSPFRWVNPLKQNDLPRTEHHTFKSPSMGVEVGYVIYFPPGYHEPQNASHSYPVVYYLHGGRPGDETKSVRLIPKIDDVMKSGDVQPAIYVFVNGGPVSHYDMPNQPEAQGESVFVKELVPHVDATYRTIADRSGRAVEGFSQGGRGTARIMFKHPDLFCSAAPGGGGMATEKRISEEEGRESERLQFAPGDNVWDLAREYAASPHRPLRILVYVGTEDFNYEANLEWMRHLESLGIPFEKHIVDGVPHSANQHYEKHADKLVKFHSDSFQSSARPQ